MALLGELFPGIKRMAKESKAPLPQSLLDAMAATNEQLAPNIPPPRKARKDEK